MTASWCILELADSSKLLTLHTSREVRVALDLLLSAGYAGNGQSLPGLASLRDSPMGVNGLAVDHGFAVAAIVIKVAETLTWYLGSPHETGEKVCSCPNLRAKAILCRNALGGRCASWCWGWVLVGCTLVLVAVVSVPVSWELQSEVTRRLECRTSRVQGVLAPSGCVSVTTGLRASMVDGSKSRGSWA